MTPKTFVNVSPVNKNTTFEGVLLKSTEKVQSASGDRKRVQIKAIQILQRREFINQLMVDIGKKVGEKIVPPDLPEMPSHISGPEAAKWMLQTNQDWATELKNSLVNAACIGHIEYSPGHATYCFYEKRKKFGLLQHQLRRVRTTHEITKPRLHRLPAASVAKPRKAERIIKTLQQCPALEKNCRVVTGFLLSKKQETSKQWTEDTLLKKGLVAGKATAKVVAKGLGYTAAAAGVVAAGTAMLLAAPLVAIPVALADPAIVIGDLVIWGWCDE